MSGDPYPYRFKGLIAEMTCHPQRADLSVAALPWLPTRKWRSMTILGIAATCAEAQALAWAMLGMIVSFRPQGLN